MTWFWSPHGDECLLGFSGTWNRFLVNISLTWHDSRAHLCRCILQILYYSVIMGLVTLQKNIFGFSSTDITLLQSWGRFWYEIHFLGDAAGVNIKVFLLGNGGDFGIDSVVFGLIMFDTLMCVSRLFADW